MWESSRPVTPHQRAFTTEEAPSTQGVRATRSVHVRQPPSSATPGPTQLAVHKQGSHGGRDGGYT